MGYLAACGCGGVVRVNDKADPRICIPCDVKNREVILRYAVTVRFFDDDLADFLVVMSSYQGEFEDASFKEPTGRRVVKW